MTTIFYIICLLLKFSSTYTIDNSVENDTEQPIVGKNVTSSESTTQKVEKILFENSLANTSRNNYDNADRVSYSKINSIKNLTEYGNTNLSNRITESNLTELNQIYFARPSLMNTDNGTGFSTLEYLPTYLSSTTNSLHETNAFDRTNDDLDNVSESNYYNNRNWNFLFNLTEIENDVESLTKNQLVSNEKPDTTFSGETVAPVDLFNGDDRKTLINDDDKFDSQNITENEREEQRYACADCTPFTDGIHHDTSHEPKHVKRDEEKSMYAYRGNSIHKQHINGNVLSSTENVFAILPTLEDKYEQYTSSTEGAATYTENVLNYLNNGDVGTISANDDKDTEENYGNLTIINASFELDVMSVIPTNGSLEPRDFDDITSGDFSADFKAFTKSVSDMSAPNSTAESNFNVVQSVLSNLNTTWPVRHAAVVEGDLILGGLMMVHSREETIMCGQIMPQGGIQALEAMLFTIDRINEIGLLPNIKLGAHILDDCDRDTYGLEMAVDFIKGTFYLFIRFSLVYVRICMIRFAHNELYLLGCNVFYIY